MHADTALDRDLIDIPRQAHDDATRDDVAVHFLRDGSALAFDEISQALFSFDPVTAYLWCRLADGAVRTELASDLAARADLTIEAAEGVVDGCLDGWRRMALLSGGEPTPAAANDEPADEPRRTDFAPAAARRGLIVAGAAYELRCASAAIAEALEPLIATLPTYALDRVADADVDGCIDVTWTAEERAEIYIDGWRVADGCPLERLAPMLKYCLTSDRVDGRTHEVALHAGAVVVDDRTGVLLAGPAGSGKSTLGAGLMGAGCGHVADDTVLFDTDSGLFRGFGFAAGIKEGAWPVIAARTSDLAHAPTFTRDDDLAVRFLARQQPVDEAVDVGLVVFPSYRNGAAQHSEDLDTGTALRRLLAESGSGSGRMTAAMFHRLVEWLDGTKAVTLTYGGLDDAIATVCGLARAP